MPLALSTGMLRWFPLLLVGCAPATDPPDRTTSPYAPSSPPTASPSIEPARAAAAIPELVNLVAAAAPQRLVATYEAMMEHGDANCPGEEVNGEVRSWFAEEPCSSFDGTTFAGEGYLRRYSDDGGDVVELGVELLDIETSDGRYLSGTFSLYLSSYAGEGDLYDVFELQAQMVADPTTAAGNPWLSGTRGGVSMEASDIAGARLLSVYGNVLASQMGDVVAASFSEFTIGNGDCAVAVNGAASLRDPEGLWHDARYDDAACDACGTLRVGPTLLGDFCHDDALAQMLAWEGTPW